MFFKGLSVVNLIKVVSFRLLSASLVGVNICLFRLTFAQAQVVPDASLPVNSIVSSAGATTQVDGGTRVNLSLFHSFGQFSVPENEVVFFNNPLDIENVFARVTGAMPSEIDGILRSAGTANLFLLNPNSIIFGESSQLDVGGSFLASTADYIEFAGNVKFSSQNTDFQPLLTISEPIGLGFTNSSAEIVNRSLNVLQVPRGETIALVGGDISLPGGRIFVDSGYIELVSVNGPGLLSIRSDDGRLELDDSSISDFQDISLSQGSFLFIDVGANVEGGISIHGQSINLTENSFVFASNSGAEAEERVSLSAADTIKLSDGSIVATQSSGTGSAGDISISARRFLIDQDAFILTQATSGNLPSDNAQPGNIRIQATELVEIIGTTSEFSSRINSIVDGTASGENTSILIETDRLVLSEGAQVTTTTLESGKGSDLIINASESIILSDAVEDAAGDLRPTGLFARSEIDSTGDAGAVTINTQRFVVQGGAQVSTDTKGDGNAGDLGINAMQSIRLLGTSDDGELASGLFAQVDEGASGDSGTLQLNTTRLEIIDGAQVSTSARSAGRGGTLIINADDSILVSGVSFLEDAASASNILVSAEPGATRDAGDLRISTDVLTVENGGKISADNFGSGNGSTATLNVRQLLIRDGGRVGAGSLIDPDDPDFDRSQLGSGGTLTVNASEKIEISGERLLGGEPIISQLFTRAEGAGPAGNLVINETPGGNLVVIVRDDAEISASTDSSTGGNIIFNGPDAVLLRTGGRLTAEAGLSQGFGDGGNITLLMPDGFLISVADEDSDIVANAFAGSGGNINITAQGIFNLVERPAIRGNGTNDIDASSQFGESGTVVLNNLDLDPTQDLIELPTDTTPPTVAQRCLADSEGQSAFVVTGQGGAPPIPRDIVRNESAGLVDLGGDLPVSQHESQNNIITTTANNTFVTPSPPLIEAQSWQRDHNGDVVLMAQTPNPPAPAQYSAVCPQV